MTSGKSASAPLLVALGIGASRLAGLGRESVAARLLGNTAAGDAFAVAMRIPNMLANLLGEGVLSASFVPVYSRLLHEATDANDRQRSSEVAGSVAAAVMATVGLATVVLVTLARPITFLLAPGLSDDRFELAVSLVRITSVGMGFAVLSAWCLGVLNSHRRFFVSYAAPVVWNAVQVGALIAAWILAFDLDSTARALAWGVAGGGLAQLLVQFPSTLRLLGGLRLRWRHRPREFVEIRNRFVPAVLGRGVVQVSAYVDLMLASLLATGAVAALFRAQLLYMLPVSLFAMSVAAAELPEMSRLSRNVTALWQRSRLAIRRVSFWMMLTTAGMLATGDLMVALLFEGGAFSSADTVLVWFVMAAYALGLPATGINRVLQSMCYAVGDTAGPARIAALRVVISAAIGVVVMFPLDRVIVSPGALIGAADALGFAWALPLSEREAADVVRLGALGLATGSAIGAWAEFAMLTRRVRSPLGIGSTLARLMPAAALAFAVAAGLKLITASWLVLLAAPLVGVVASGVYVVTAHRSGVREADMVLRPIRRRLWKS